MFRLTKILAKTLRLIHGCPLLIGHAELYAVILAGEQAYASLASFGLANHALHDVGVPLLDKTVVLDQHTAGYSGVLRRCIVANEENFKHTR